MKKYAFTAAAAVLLLAGLVLNAQKMATRVKHVGNTNIAGQWVLLPLLAADTANDPIPSLTFNVVGLRFIGNTGCNNFSGKLQMKGNRLSFAEQSVLTQNTCFGDKEDRFMAGLIQVNQFKITNGLLQLMHNGTTLSKWVRKAPENRGKKV